ncbi:MAG: PIN domain-containing protein [Candidatus Poribacteria bacterium]|nr:PIN domain-containing protein [Candidatus Poribacteria bacterium]
MHFVDTNVLLYAVSALSEDTVKRHRALDLLDTADLALSVQVLQEFYHQATRPSRTGALTRAQALEFIESIGHFPVQDVTVDLFRAGAAISERFQLSYWDGAILAAAQALDCDVLYSEDLNAGQDYAGVRVVNPFIASAPP